MGLRPLDYQKKKILPLKRFQISFLLQDNQLKGRSVKKYEYEHQTVHIML
jgi:hypothetical protein